MKLTAFLFCLCLCLTGFSLKSPADDHVEFVCMKKHMATKTCHYNFKIDGAKYRYVDIGCKYKSTEKVVEKAKAGEVALARDWTIVCPEAKNEDGL